MTTEPHNPAEINQDALRSALKPCPFCGKAPTMIPDGSGNHYVRCMVCYIAGDYGTEKHATEAWNTRAAIPQEGAAARRAVLAEREACALIADEDANETEGSWQAEAGYRIAAAIRRRPAP